MSFAFRLKELTKTFPGGLRALEALSDEIDEGEFLALVGPSGCGKSTLLRILAGLESADASGAVERAPGLESHGELSMVFQEPALLPWRDLRSNVELPLEIGRQRIADPSRRRSIAERALAEVGLGGFEHRAPHELSGGMKMRASLARALVSSPKALLLDEPFAALDEFTRGRLDDDLRRLWSRGGLTVAFVTHSIEEAVFLANRVWVFSARPGRRLLDLRLEGLPRDRSSPLRREARFQSLVARVEESFRQGWEPGT